MVRTVVIDEHEQQVADIDLTEEGRQQVRHQCEELIRRMDELDYHEDAAQSFKIGSLVQDDEGNTGQVVNIEGPHLYVLFFDREGNVTDLQQPRLAGELEIVDSPSA
jgi:hypothetical protein